MPWTGYCNQCGLCCVKVIKGEPYICTNLMIKTALGWENGSQCKVYNERFDFMPIVMRTQGGKEVVDVCMPRYPSHLGPDDKVPDGCTYVYEV